MEQHINTYQGMNKDTAYDSLAATFYIDALDIRITTTAGESLGAFTNIKGNSLIIKLNTEGEFNGNSWIADNPVVIGYTTIRTKIILFIADDSSTKGWIYNLEYDPADKSLSSFQLIYYNKELNFNKEWPIEALGRYESDCIQRIYWTDYNNFFRSLNILDPNLVNLPSGLIDIFPDVKFTQPLLYTVAAGGSLNTGEYQIAYRLITADGKQTLISPPSNLIHIVSDSETGIPSNEYKGNSTTINSGKAISIKLDTSNYWDFYKIEFIAIYKSSASATTEVMSIEQVTIANQSSILFTYTGNETSIFDLELFDFLSRNYPFKTPKTLTPKDNSLLIANIKESTISIQDLLGPGETFSALTGRYNSSGNLPTLDNLENAFNIGYNSDAHWDIDWQNNQQYRYKSDGTRLGGEGVNIKYNFHLEKYTLDTSWPINRIAEASVLDDPDSSGHNLSDGAGFYYNTTFPNYASPFISGLLRGYKRGETYRFGIVFYTKKGEATFVEYIGDIKFPDISEVDAIPNASGYKFWPLITTDTTSTPYITYGYAMGIQFDIDFSTCPTLFDQIESYQIVRVKRTEGDKRRLTQGFIKGFYYNPILDPFFTGTGGFDLKVNDNNNVLHIYPYYPPVAAYGQPQKPNACFSTLEDSDNIYSYTKQFLDYLILGSRLGFYSPEISYNLNNVRDNILNTGADPCLLITGAYQAGYGTAETHDFSSENLGNYIVHSISKSGNTYPVTYNTIQGIKKWKFNKLIHMDDVSDYKQKVTPLWDGYYMRNYWCMDNWELAYSGDIQVNPNRPQGLGPNNDKPEFSRAGTSIVGQVEKITTNFFTGNPLTTYSAFDYFKAPYTPAAHNIPGDYYLSGLLREDLSPAIDMSDQLFPIIDCVLPKLEVYGGYTLNSLESNKFIPASPIIDKIATQPIVYGGDIFLNMFVLQDSMLEITDTNFYANNKYHQNNNRVNSYPVESNLNLDLAYGASFRVRSQYEVGTLNNETLIQETNNILSLYGASGTMYLYNQVYSRENDDLGFYVQPADLHNCGANDIRAYLSNVKINEETIDSWTKFGINNYYDIDDYGPINKVINWKDIVYFIQDKGVGAYTINRAAVTTTADGVPTQLGTGLGFGKHIYFSKVHGSIHQWAVQTTEAGIYFFDAFHRKIFMMQSQSGQTANTAISEIKGMHSFLQSLPSSVFTRKENGGDNPILGYGVHIGKDIINDEVLFTFLSKVELLNLNINTSYSEGNIIYNSANNTYYYVINTFTTGDTIFIAAAQLLANSVIATARQVYQSDTIVFDELAQQFSSKYSMTPSLWIQNGDIIITPNPLNPIELYSNSTGDWGVFYNKQETCELTLVINPQADINKVLRTIEFNSIVRDNNKIIDRTQTITAFRISTQYQDTNIVPFSADRFKRKFDKWRLKIPRDQMSSSQQGRLRGTYFIVTLYFNNAVNKELIMNRLMSYFDYQVF